MNWIPLKEQEQLTVLHSQSAQVPVLVFKHSTRCGISRFALKAFEQAYSLPEGQVITYLLDLLSYRSISHELAEKYQVIHASPQVLLISKGSVIYHHSHQGIDMEDMTQVLVEKALIEPQ
ncbi:MAG: bacillithiol system redox-active protein YtxJ [Lutibacter sp.]|jgi:bacillithiol system protein YtxJ|nr:bacillithiol system redox-active protein YtxJ [Lutibacter sp.]